MLDHLKRPRRAAVLMSGITVATTGLMLFTGTAFATTNPTTAPQSSLLVGSGSATTYNLMQQMDVLFNSAPGCDLITTSLYNQPLNISCLQGQETTAPPDQGSTSFYPTYENPQTGAYQDGYTENPENDYAVEAPPLGSGNGIKSLETLAGVAGGSGASSCASAEAALANQSYARSSRAPASSDCAGLNFVAYALDGVSFFHYPEVDGHDTPSNAINNFTTTNLVDAWSANSAGTAPDLECWNDPSIGTNESPTMTYTSKGCEPIIVYAAQSGSGTTSTWSSFIGLTTTTISSAINDLCSANSGKGTTIKNLQSATGTTRTETFSGSKCAAHDNILENEDRAIINNGDEANALFYYSYGKFQVTCAVKECGKTGLTGKTTEELGDINSIAPNANTILCGALGTDSSGVNECVNGSSTYSPFAPTRFIYNVYSDGTNPDIPAATLPTLNYVSEDGFICKPNTIDGTDSSASSDRIDDAVSGSAYRIAYAASAGSLPTGEISSVISSQGFLAMPFQANEGSTGDTYNTITNTANGSGTQAPFAQELVQSDLVGQTASVSQGYCLVTNTDSGHAN